MTTTEHHPRPDLIEGRWSTTYCPTLTCQEPVVQANTDRGVKAFDVESSAAGTHALRDSGGVLPMAAALPAKLRYGRTNLYTLHKCKGRRR